MCRSRMGFSSYLPLMHSAHSGEAEYPRFTAPQDRQAISEADRRNTLQPTSEESSRSSLPLLSDSTRSILRSPTE